MPRTTAPAAHATPRGLPTRSLLPCQDTPQVKITYDARVTCPSPLTVLMSALGNGDAPVATSDGEKTFTFTQPVAMATYLVAFAVGVLETRPVGERTAVWGEPEVVDKAAREFAEMEDVSSCSVYCFLSLALVLLP